MTSSDLLRFYFAFKCKLTWWRELDRLCSTESRSQLPPENSGCYGESWCLTTLPYSTRRIHQKLLPSNRLGLPSIWKKNAGKYDCTMQCYMYKYLAYLSKRLTNNEKNIVHLLAIYNFTRSYNYALSLSLWWNPYLKVLDLGTHVLHDPSHIFPRGVGQCRLHSVGTWSDVRIHGIYPCSLNFDQNLKVPSTSVMQKSCVWNKKGCKYKP